MVIEAVQFGPIWPYIHTFILFITCIPSFFCSHLASVRTVMLLLHLGTISSWVRLTFIACTLFRVLSCGFWALQGSIQCNGQFGFAKNLVSCYKCLMSYSRVMTSITVDSTVASLSQGSEQLNNKVPVITMDLGTLNEWRLDGFCRF